MTDATPTGPLAKNIAERADRHFDLARINAAAWDRQFWVAVSIANGAGLAGVASVIVKGEPAAAQLIWPAWLFILGLIFALALSPLLSRQELSNARMHTGTVDLFTLSKGEDATDEQQILEVQTYYDLHKGRAERLTWPSRLLMFLSLSAFALAVSLPLWKPTLDALGI